MKLFTASNPLSTAGTVSPTEPLADVAGFKNNFFLNLFFLLGAVLLLAPALGPVPSSNENVYLIYLAKLWDPTLLARDWTFAGPLYGHLIFSYLFGSLTLLFSLETVAWIGRVLSWSLILAGLLQISRHFAIPLWMSSVAIFLWLLYQQSPVGGEWVLGTFEGKCVAYIFLFFAISEFMKERDILASVLLGLSFVFHPVVGMWALLATGCAFLLLRYPFTRLLKIGLAVLISAAPGLIVALPTVSGGWSVTQEQARYLAVIASPFHLDPLSFPKRDVFLLLVLASFNWLFFKSVPDSKGLRLLHYFVLALGLFSLLGVAARLVGHYRFLLYFPFRLFPVFVPLIFFFCLMSACRQGSFSRATGRALLALGLVALLCLPGAAAQFLDQAKRHYAYWTTFYDWDDLQKTFIWVSENTPKDATVILPPWRKESFYLSKRATVAHWATPRMDRFQEWQERIEVLVGKTPFDSEQLSGARWDKYYNSLSESAIATVVASYGGEYLISEAQYTYPMLFDSGTYKVYSLPATRKANP